MPRRRNLDPVGLSEQPTCVTDPVRRAERLAEFRRRLEYLEQHFRMGKAFYGSVPQFNHAAHALKAQAAGDATVAGKYERLPPIIELAVSVNARRFARERTDEADARVEGQDIRRAAKYVAERLGPISNRPRADNLIYHVKGLMALIQDFSGRPVVPRRNLNSEYGPHFMPGVSNIVTLIFRHLEPTVTTTQLVTIAERARKEWAGERKRFRDYFPGYGLTVQPNGSLASGDGLEVAHFEPNIPTYFHSRG